MPQLAYSLHQPYGHLSSPHQQQQQLGQQPHQHHQHHGGQLSPRSAAVKVEPQPAIGPDHASTPASYDGGPQRAGSSPGTPDPSSSSAAHLDPTSASAAEAADKKEQQKKALRRNMACHQCRRRSVSSLFH